MSISEEERRLNRLIQEEDRPKTYLQLVDKLGGSGPYQKRLFLVFTLNWFVTGIILLSTGFLFRTPNFDCRANGLLVSPNDCSLYVCRLEESRWESYLSPDIRFRSLATTGNYLCGNSFTIDIVSSFTYVGAFLGYLTISYLADNYGRKRALLMAWSVCAMGSIIVATSFHIAVAAVGFFLSGFGSDVSISISLLFFSEAVSGRKRQKYSIAVQCFFAVGALVVTLFFFIFENWRVVWCLLVTAPALVQLILIYCYVEETPQFLVRRGVEEALTVLNRVGKVNLDRRETLEEQDIQSVIDYQLVDQFKSKLVLPVDLCRFSSLRVPTVVCCFLSFATYAMYYGPVLIIKQVGTSVFLSSTLVQLSQLVVYIPAFIWIQKLSRKKMGITLFAVASSVSFILVFLQRPYNCDNCYQTVIQLTVGFIFRACVSLFFCFFQVEMCEIYPARIRAIGVGVISSFGTLATALNPLYLGLARLAGFNPFSIFLIFGMVAIVCLSILPETKGGSMPQEIAEIEKEKENLRTMVILRTPKVRRRDHRSQITSQRLQSTRMIQSNRVN